MKPCITGPDSGEASRSTFQIFSEITEAETGKCAEVMPLASVTISGSSFMPPVANQDPVRPKPVMTSSAMKRMSCFFKIGCSASK